MWKRKKKEGKRREEEGEDREAWWAWSEEGERSMSFPPSPPFPAQWKQAHLWLVPRGTRPELLLACGWRKTGKGERSQKRLAGSICKLNQTYCSKFTVGHLFFFLFLFNIEWRADQQGQTPLINEALLGLCPIRALRTVHLLQFAALNRERSERVTFNFHLAEGGKMEAIHLHKFE